MIQATNQETLKNGFTVFIYHLAAITHSHKSTIYAVLRACSFSILFKSPINHLLHILQLNNQRIFLKTFVGHFTRTVKTTLYMDCRKALPIWLYCRIPEEERTEILVEKSQLQSVSSSSIYAFMRISFALSVCPGNKSTGTFSLPSFDATMYRAHCELSPRQ